MTDWKKIREEWEATDITFVDLADKYNLKASTIRSRKNREKWQRNDNVTQRKNVATQKKSVAKKKEPIADEVKSVMENDDLTDKQRLFCLYYTKYFNATKAYKKAYGCDEYSAMTNGSRLLSNDKVRNQIQSLKQGKLNRAMFDEMDLFQMYLDIATADINDFVEYGQEEVAYRADDGIPRLYDEGNGITYKRNYVNFKDSDAIDGSLISEVSQGRSGVKIKLQDKMKAMEWLDKHIGMATEEQKLRIKKLKVDIEKVEGNEEELSKLDKILEGIDNAAKS